MKVKITLFVLFFLALGGLFAQQRYMVHFTDKGNVIGINEAELFSPRAIANRVKNGVAIDESDFPVNPDYLLQLKSLGTIKKTSKWLNAAILESEASAKQIIQLNCVSHVEELSTGVVTKGNKFYEEEKFGSVKSFNYDSTFQMITQIDADCMHDKGFTGQNVLLAVLDAGFQGMDTISFFDSLYLQNRIIDTYDFIDNDAGVYEKHNHGTMVASVIAGNGLGYVGSAPHVDLCLYITEDVSREVHEEEFDLVRGLERADSIGADLVNISLSYLVFDTLEGDYTYNDMDGETTIAANGARMAANKGLLIVCSAGNSGPDYIRTPCDADSILCVGATDTNNVKANFSSVGPSADNRVKPDVAAIGRRAFCVENNGTIRTCNGTSFSSPLVCGMVACLIQSHPTLTMMEVINSVKESAHQFSTPDSLYGYGIPDACVADSLLELLEITTGIGSENLLEVSVFPNPASDYMTIQSDELIQQVEFFSVTGQLVKQLNTSKNVLLVNCADLPKGAYILRVNMRFHERFIKR